MQAKYKIWALIVSGLVVGFVVWRGSVDTAEVATAAGEDPYDGATGAEQLGQRSTRSGPAILTRPVSSAAQPDYEGVEADDWDTITRDERIARTEAAVEALKAEMATVVSQEQQRALEEQALEVLAHARADYFQEPSTTERYIELEAGLGG